MIKKSPLLAAFLCSLFGTCLTDPLLATEPQPSPDYRWVWVQKIDSGKLEDATVTSLAVGADGLWIGGQFDNKHYIQKFALGGQPLLQRITLGKGDSVNDLVLGSSGEVFGVADVWTSSSQRPGYFFVRRTNGTITGTRLGATTSNGSAGYGDAYGIDRSGQWIYATGYLNPDRLGDSKTAYFGDKPLSLFEANLPEGAYAAFLVKINAGNGAVAWAKFLGADSGDSVKVGTDGKIYVAGADFDWNGPGFVRCLSDDGSLVWSNQTESFVNSLALDTSGDVWVSNRFAGALQKFARGSGDLALTIPLPGAVASLAVGSHPSGGVVALCHGQWSDEVGREAGFRLYRVNAGGDILWSKHISGGLAFRGAWSKVSVTQRGDVYVAFSAASWNDYDYEAGPVFSEVTFEGYNQAFPFVDGEESSKGFVALLRDFAAPPPDSGGTKPQVVNFVLPPRMVYGSTYVLGARASSGLPVAYEVGDASFAEIMEGNRLRILRPGSFTVTARQGGDSVWEAAESVSLLATAEKRPQRIAFGARRIVRVGQVFSLRASVNSSLPVTVESSNPSVLQIDGLTATALAKGTVKLTATQEGDENYAGARPVMRTVTVR